MIRSRTFIATPPGATIREQLALRGMLQIELAKRMGMSEKHISKLINGEVHLTPDVALRLEMVLGVPSEFWTNLEGRYREKEARAIAENEMDNDIELSKNYPYNAMVKVGWVTSTGIASEKVYNLRRFFEVAKLELVEKLRAPGAAYRVVGASKTSDYALAVWAQKARIEARKINTEPINLQRLNSSLEEIRKMTTQDPKIFCSNLTKVLASCGIAIVFLPHIGGSFLHGASFCDGNHIVMGLTVRGRDADRFWFSLFHEISHILRGDINTDHETIDEQEREADAFARDILIPPEKYAIFINSDSFSETAIVSFAHLCQIDSGIVVGRLQKENYIQYTQFNHMKTKYRITD